MKGGPVSSILVSMKRALPVLTLMVLALPALAQTQTKTVYKWVMPDGSIEFSDRPQEEGAVLGEAVELQVSEPGAQAGAAAPGALPAGQDTGTDPDGTAAGYDSIAVTSPTEGQSIRDNGGNVSISLALKPALRPDDVIELFMDGTSVGTGRSTSVTMTNVDRGSHTVQAAVRDKAGKQVITSGAVTFHLLRVAAGS